MSAFFVPIDVFSIKIHAAPSQKIESHFKTSFSSSDSHLQVWVLYLEYSLISISTSKEIWFLIFLFYVKAHVTS